MDMEEYQPNDRVKTLTNVLDNPPGIIGKVSRIIARYKGVTMFEVVTDCGKTFVLNSNHVIKLAE